MFKVCVIFPFFCVCVCVPACLEAGHCTEKDRKRMSEC